METFTRLADDLLALLPAGCEPLALLPAGSDLYNTKTDFHDVDAAAVTRFGRPRSYQSGDLDLRALPLKHLMLTSARGSLVECETLFALESGHGLLFDDSFRPWLRQLRAPFPAYASATERMRARSAFRPKDGVRWDIYIERAWRTGNLDPRLTEDERGQFLERMAELPTAR